MLRIFIFAAALFLAASVAQSQEEENAAAEEAQAQDDEPKGSKEPGGARSMSGMSILGNEEAPKSLVIIPWRSSELGEGISLSDTLDDRAKPVDRDVFLRNLSFYEIRAGE